MKEEATARRKAKKDAEKADADYFASWKKRLPDGSTFSATYNATDVMWTGTLHVPGSAPVVGAGATSSKLLHTLARTWDVTLTGENES